MPMEKIKANKDTRFKVNPHAQEAKRVIASVTIMATPTTKDSRAPMVKKTNTTTALVAKISFKIRVLDLSAAVSP